MTICSHCGQDLICIGCRHLQEECTCVSIEESKNKDETKELTEKQVK